MLATSLLVQGHLHILKTTTIIINIFNLSTADALSFDKSKISSFGKQLILHHTILTFNNLENRRLLETMWEKEIMLGTSIFSFSHKIPTLRSKKF